MIFIKLVKQTQYNDCSLACLSMIINYYYDQNYDVDRMKLENNYDDEMLSFFDISNLSSRYFLKSSAFQVEQDLEQINQKIYLAQIVNEQGLLHFVVVQKAKDLLIVYDPSKTKKQKLTYQQFYKNFTGYVLTFQANKKQFQANFNHIKSIFTNFNWYYLLYILISLFSVLLVVLEMRFLYLYSLSIANPTNSVYLYFYFLFIFLINIFLNEVLKVILNHLYKTNKQKKTQIFYSYLVENNTVLDLVNCYSEIKFLASYQTIYFLNFLASLISSTVILAVIFYINKLIFFVMLIFDVIWLAISFIFKSISNKRSLDQNQEAKLVSSLFNKELLYQKAMIDQLINQLDDNKTDLLNLCFLLIEKLSLLVVYFVSWKLLKFNYLEFSLSITSYLFKSLHTGDLKKIVSFMQNYAKYQQLVVKFQNYHQEIKYYQFETIDSFSLKDLLNNQQLTFDQKINFISKDYDLNLLTKQTKQLDHILIYINEINIKNISKLMIKQHITNLDHLTISYATIFQNIVLETNKTNIFTNQVIANLLNKYQIDLTMIVSQNLVSKKVQEIIKLLRIFYLNSKYILLKDDFEIISKSDVLKVLQLFNDYNSNSLLITTFNYTKV
ncbi:cysteine peptidase family C39 domain-containing protein [Mycoplasma putrefaciens]|uniref:Peptidase C39 family domain protein n=1 Tax=Mycoplasma putrefaciens (strain ATCC 15718 / NCTC 10155 / C30 KS-1 / KS-1) TaxID=743965 RepID=A0A7U4E9P0_MYCPK|nr:cysteine peptidase family C39 domain-containing protein [Mycoplasma putrefaciens]AEM68700.1 peptidase C39 family domain protein [Mycoplasma putrefaciens KS1]